MKKLFLFLFASLLSVSMFAAGESGKTKAQAIPYDWSTGIYVSSEAGVGKWYVVHLLKDTQHPERPFNANGKTDDGKTDINITIKNPLDTEVDINCTAYIGDNETNRHFKMAASGSKSMTFGAGMFVRMGINEVYLYLVTDVTVTKEQAEEQHQAVNVDVQPVEANSIPFEWIEFNWEGFPAKTAGTTIPANKETWVKFDFSAEGHFVTNGNTYKFSVEKENATPITINAGVSYDCPATSIQEQSQELKSASTAKILDEAKLSMIPGIIYIRIKAPQALTIYAEEVALPDPTGPVLFNKDDAVEVELYNGTPATEYSLNNGQLAYKVGYNTLKAEENYYRQIEVTNNEDHEITIVGKATKTFVDGKAYSAVSKSVTIPAGQTYYKKIDKTMQSAVGSAEGDTIWAVGPAFNVTFKLTQQPNDPEYCQTATPFVWNEWNQQNGGYQWYEVNIAAAKAAKADIILTMETVDDNEEANITVDIAAACALGEPMQNYTGKSKSTTKTLSYSLFKGNANDEMYVRVRTDKNIKVMAKLQTTKTWNGTEWSGDGEAPTLTEAARIEGNMTIANGVTIKALGLTLDTIPGIQPKQYATITIEEGGKLVVGKEGIKGSETVDQIIIEEGGVLLIDPAATTNNKPFITAKKGIRLGKQKASGAQLDELHDFIALPIDNREAGVGTFMRYSNWIYTEGWKSSDNFRKAFVGYNVFIKATDSQCPENPELVPVVFKGQLAANKNQTLTMPGEGWHAFGNSWFEPIPVENIYNQLGAGSSDDVAVHKYIATPQDVNGVPYKDNQYALITSENYDYVSDSFKVIAPMQGFFLYTQSAKSVTMSYSNIFNANAAPAKRAAKQNVNNVAVVVRGGNGSDHVFMVETTGSNVHKMMNDGLALYAEDGLGQVANENLIGTILTLQTNEATEYTLNFAWLKGETLVLLDLENGNTIDMTADNTYTFTAEPNTVSERFQVVGRKSMPTAIENTNAIKGVNKVLENGKVVIIKNGVKYNVLGAQL